MRHIVTFLKINDELFPATLSRNRLFKYRATIENIAKKMEWLADHPFGKAMRRSNISYAHIDYPPDSVVITSELSDEDRVLLFMSGSENILVRNEDDIPSLNRKKQDYRELLLREPDPYARPTKAVKLRPSDFPVVKRARR